MKFIRDKQEIVRLIQEIHRADQHGGLGISKNFVGWSFWNATGKEDTPDFPTVYFPKDLAWKVVNELVDGGYLPLSASQEQKANYLAAIGEE